MNAFATPGSGTAHQRQFIRVLMRELELDTDRATAQHGIPFRNAGLPQPPPGNDLDAHLRTLSKAQASSLIRALKQQADVEEGAH